jgi:oxalate decarboxylase
MFKADRFMDLSLSEWVSNTPAELVIQHLGISRETLQAIPTQKALIMPE